MRRRRARRAPPRPHAAALRSRRDRPGRRRFLDDLLVAALQRAVALAERDHAALAVAEDLHLDVARVGHEAFEDRRGRRRSWPARCAARSSNRSRSSLGVGAELHADAAAAGGALQHHRDSRCARPRRSASSTSASTPVPGSSGTPLALAISRAVCLRPKARRCSGRGPMKAMPAAASRSAKRGILRQKAVAGMHRLGAGRSAGRDHRVDVEIARRGRRRPEPHGLVGVEHRPGEAVGVGIDRDGGDAQPPQRAADPGGDLAAVGDQNLAEHQSLGAPDQHADRRRVEAVAGIVDLRAVGDDAEHVHLGAEFDVVAGLRHAIDDGEFARGLDRHVHEEVDVGHDVALGHAVPADLQQEILAAGVQVSGAMAEAHGVGSRTSRRRPTCRAGRSCRPSRVSMTLPSLDITCVPVVT